MRWRRTGERTWQAECDGATLYVTRRRPKPGVLFSAETYWPTVKIGKNFTPLVGVETLAEAKAACEAEVGVMA
jgi:hypothetical protein